MGCEDPPTDLEDNGARDDELRTIISLNVFQLPQALQRPAHLGDSLPHCVHTNMLFSFGMGLAYFQMGNEEGRPL